MTYADDQLKIAIAGASGFIGAKLIEEILNKTNWQIHGMSRSSRQSENEKLTWHEADLFSVLDIEKAVKGCDIAVYLVHSMQPSAHLDQANFADYDLILADNFGRACKQEGVKQVLYLGGLMPKKGELSKHLASRLEVEKTLKLYTPHHTFFRAAMVLGKEGSSFQILVNLVRRLPVMLCPGWTDMPTSPVHVDLVVKSFMLSINEEKYFDKTYDLSSADEMSYFNLLKTTARILGLKTKMLKIRHSFIGLSRLWVSLVSGAPKSLVYPLLYSLKNVMVAAPDKKFPLLKEENETVEEGLKKALAEVGDRPFKFKTRKVDRKTVRSVQRGRLPEGMSARDAALEYMAWLPRALRPFLLVESDERNVIFCLFTKKWRLLRLKYSPERSESTRQIFYIKGGMLAAPMDRGRLEFREVLNKTHLLAAIHDFYPALPWYIYVYTQAIVHLIVMKLFVRHLKKVSKGERKWIHKRS